LAWSCPILDGGECEWASSTIIDLSSSTRESSVGRITHAQIEAVIGPVAQDQS
jgi:hypothetical protein